jgi:sugar (pentulose or hexulose) kinase
LVGLPVHYRDARTNGVPERVFARVPRSDVFAQTGIQIMPINTLYQMVALAERQPRLLDAADTLLFMPDLFHYFLSGRAAPEFTIATTSQMYDGRRGDWAQPLLDTLSLPARLLPSVVPPGEEYGTAAASSGQCDRGRDRFPSLRRAGTTRPARWPRFRPRVTRVGRICRRERGRLLASR